MPPILLVWAIFTKQLLNTFDLLLVFKFHSWSINYIYLNEFTLKTFYKKLETKFLYPKVLVKINYRFKVTKFLIDFDVNSGFILIYFGAVALDYLHSFLTFLFTFSNFKLFQLFKRLSIFSHLLRNCYTKMFILYAVWNFEGQKNRLLLLSNLWWIIAKKNVTEFDLMSHQVLLSPTLKYSLSANNGKITNIKNLVRVLQTTI